MRVSAKTRYGLLALMDMAAQQETGGGRLTTREIAARQAIPERFLEQQITAFKNAGLVISHRGAHGGCSLARPAERITVLEVIEALEGSPLEQEQIDERDGDESGLAVREIWDRARQELVRVFSAVSIADLAHRERDLRQGSAVMFYV